MVIGVLRYVAIFIFVKALLPESRSSITREKLRMFVPDMFNKLSWSRQILIILTCAIQLLSALLQLALLVFQLLGKFRVFLLLYFIQYLCHSSLLIPHAWIDSLHLWSSFFSERIGFQSLYWSLWLSLFVLYLLWILALVCAWRDGFKFFYYMLLQIHVFKHLCKLTRICNFVFISDLGDRLYLFVADCICFQNNWLRAHIKFLISGWCGFLWTLWYLFPSFFCVPRPHGNCLVV